MESIDEKRTIDSRPPILGVGWLSDDRSYVKLRLEGKEYIMKRSKLTEKKTPGQADYLIYPKTERPPIDMDFVPEIPVKAE